MQKLRIVYTSKKQRQDTGQRAKTESKAQANSKLNDYCLNRLKTQSQFGYMPKQLRIQVNGKNLSPYFSKNTKTELKNRCYTSVKSPMSVNSQQKIDVRSFIYRKYINQKVHEEQPLWHKQNVMKLRKILKKKNNIGHCKHYNETSYIFRNSNKRCACPSSSNTQGQQMIRVTNPDIFARTLCKRISHRRENIKLNYSISRNITEQYNNKNQGQNSGEQSIFGLAPWQVD